MEGIGILIALIVAGVYLWAGISGLRSSLTDDADKAWEQHAAALRNDGVQPVRTTEWDAQHRRNGPFVFIIGLIALLFGGALFLLILTPLFR